jgi:hypothetical protein
MTSRSIATPTAPVSWGELIDKVTILEIKDAKIANSTALINIRHELALLQAIARPILAERQIAGLKTRLREVNEALWQIEDRIREKEAAAEFDSEFIELARSVYKTNDERSALKRQINTQLGSAIVEEKSYASY